MNCKRKSREFTLLGRFLAKSTEQIDASRVCWRQEYIKNPKSRNHRWGVTALVCQQTRGPSIRSVISVTNRPISSRKPLTSSMMLSKNTDFGQKKIEKKNDSVKRVHICAVTPHLCGITWNTGYRYIYFGSSIEHYKVHSLSINWVRIWKQIKNHVPDILIKGGLGFWPHSIAIWDFWSVVGAS